MKKILLLVSLITYQSFAQQVYQLRGIVLDENSQALVGATVQMQDDSRAYFTDDKGSFSISTQKSEIEIVVSFVGFINHSGTVSLPKKDLVIHLKPDLNTLETVIVSDAANQNIRRPILGVNSLDMKSVEKLPTALGEVDLLRGLQMLPGVSSVGEASNGVNIRGGTTDQNLFLLEEAPIFNPTHMFGLFSAFPSDAVSSFDLYKGNIPARFGGRAAAVLDVKFANPSLEKFKLQGGMSLVSNKIKIETPIIKDKLGVMLSGRGSFNDFLFPIISKDLQDLKAKFGDGAAKVFYKINDKQTLSLSSYYSYDFFQTELLGGVENINASASQFQYSTLNLSAKWFYALSNKANIQTTLVSSDYQPNNLLPEKESENVIRIQQGIKYQQLKSNLNLYRDKHNLEIGVDAVKYSINPGNIDPGTSSSVLPLNLPYENGIELGASFEDVIELNSKTTLSLGLRYSHFLLLGPSEVRVYKENEPKTERTISERINYEQNEVAQSYGGLEPRLGFKFSLNETSSIKLGYNLARQYLQIISNTTTPIPTSRWKLSDLNIKPQMSQLYSLGYFKNTVSNTFEFSVESYYRETQNIIDYKPGASFLLNSEPETEILQGINKSYGVEFMAAKTKGSLTGWANYTYARSLNQVDEGPQLSQRVNGGDWYAANYDRPHTVNATLVINQGEHHDFSFNFTYSTGRPFSAPQGYINYRNKILPYYFLRNESRIPDYHRLDFAWNIYNPKLRKRKFKGNFAFSVYNLYGRKNAYSVFFRSEENLLNPYKLTIFGSPIISLAYKFTFNH